MISANPTNCLTGEVYRFRDFVEIEAQAKLTVASSQIYFHRTAAAENWNAAADTGRRLICEVRNIYQATADSEIQAYALRDTEFKSNRSK